MRIRICARKPLIHRRRDAAQISLARSGEICSSSLVSQTPPPVPPPAATAAAPEIRTPPTRRLLSLDALRGFDMFWIVGGEELIHSLYKALPVWPLNILDRQMDHKSWIGVGFYDLIFPLFVFIVGVSLVFSLSRTIEKFGKAAAIKRIFIRSLAIYVFGLLVYGGISHGLDHVRWMGVLQRIALCYLFTGLIFCSFPPKAMVV